jgi:hypothetical protein
MHVIRKRFEGRRIILSSNLPAGSMSWIKESISKMCQVESSFKFLVLQNFGDEEGRASDAYKHELGKCFQIITVADQAQYHAEISKAFFLIDLYEALAPVDACSNIPSMGILHQVPLLIDQQHKLSYGDLLEKQLDFFPKSAPASIEHILGLSWESYYTLVKSLQLDHERNLQRGQSFFQNWLKETCLR